MMNDSEKKWYVLQVVNGRESRVENSIHKVHLQSFSCFLPYRKIKEKQQGNFIDKMIPLYPGYLFIIGEWNQLEAKNILDLSDVISFVGPLNKPGFLQKEEVDVIRMITVDNVVEYSKVVKEGNKVKILSGPLKKLEGVIQSVDRRKQRATVNLPLLGTHIKVVLSFDYIDDAKMSI